MLRAILVRELRAVGVPTNNQRGQISGPCRLCGGLDKARHVVPTALLVRVQCLRKSLYMAVEGPSTREKGRDRTQSYDKSPPHRQKNPKSNVTTQNATKKFDYTRPIVFSMIPESYC